MHAVTDDAWRHSNSNLLDLLEIILEYLYHDSVHVATACAWHAVHAHGMQYMHMHATIHVATVCQHVASMDWWTWTMHNALHQHTMLWTVTIVLHTSTSHRGRPTSGDEISGAMTWETKNTPSATQYQSHATH